MGMWDKDKEIGRRIDSVFNFGDKLVVYSVTPSGEVQTDIGIARKTKLQVAPVASPEDRQEVTTLSSAIADKAAQATSADFPVVCELLQVPTNKGNPAVVLQYVKDYEPDAAESSSTE